MKILMTGGAGYIGSACLRWMLAHGHDPVAYDDLSAGHSQAVPADRLIRGDLLDGERLEAALRDSGAEAVMHFAALCSVADSIAQPAAYWHVNVGGTRCVLDSMRRNGVSKLIFSSTAAVYRFDQPMPLGENSPTGPQVPYGTTKHTAEQLIADYAQAYGMAYSALRYFNAAGADSDGEYGEDRQHESHLIPLALRAANGGATLKIFGDDWPTRDGTCVRDYVHTEDLALAHQLALENLSDGGANTYNVGSGQGSTVLEVLRACEAAVGLPIDHEIAARRPGDPAVLVASADRLRADTGWQPRYDSIEAIAGSAWRWAKRYPTGYAGKKT